MPYPYSYNVDMLSVQDKIKKMSTADLFQMGTAICLRFAETKRLSGMEKVFYYMIKQELKRRKSWYNQVIL